MRPTESDTPEPAADTPAREPDTPATPLKALPPNPERPSRESENTTDFLGFYSSWNGKGKASRHRIAPGGVSSAKKPARSILNWFALVTLVLCGIAVVFEATLHPSAGLLQLDPIPNLGVLALYAFTVATIGFNQRVLTRSEGLQKSPRALGLLIVATVVSLLVAFSAAYMYTPLSPFAFVLLLFAGLGLLMLTPFLALITLACQLPGLVRLWREAGATTGEIRRTVGAAALAGAGLLFWLIGIPIMNAGCAAKVLHSSGAAQQKAIAGLRFWHGEGVLLDIAYQRKPNFWTCLGYNAGREGWWPTAGMHWDTNWDDLGEGVWGLNTEDWQRARRAYFLVTGKPFEFAARPMSFTNHSGSWIGGPDDVAVEETGGMTVGRMAPGLSLAASRMTGTAYPENRAATVEWTLRFKNDRDEPQEARADILIPETAAVHKVSLWINGKECPARFGHPDRVRAAYQEVAVVKRRDPLLVTQPAPGHVLAQCFPVPAHGEMQIRLGFIIPIEPGTDKRYADLPALGMVNFAVPGNLVNEVAIGGVDSLTAQTSAALFHPQRLTFGPAFPDAAGSEPVHLTVLIDASEGMADALTRERFRDWESALNLLPTGSRVRFRFTDSAEQTAEWTPGQPLPTEFLTRKRIGGTDPAAALNFCMADAYTDYRTTPTAVLFIHAASPQGVSDLTELRKTLQRDFWGGPSLIGLLTAPASPDTLIRELSGFPRVHTVRAFPQSNDFLHALQAAIATANRWASRPDRAGSPTADYFKVLFPQTGDSNAGDGEHTANNLLRVNNLVLQAWQHANTLPDAKALDLRIAAGTAAANAQLVTPLSSAVVLETEADYARNGLSGKDGKKNAADNPNAKPQDMKNPALPEPNSLYLVSLISIIFLPRLRRRRGNR